MNSRLVQVKAHQSIYDLAIMYYGEADAIYTLMLDNKHLNLVEDPLVGAMIRVRDSKSKVVEYFQKNNITLATSSTTNVVPLPPVPQPTYDILIKSSDDLFSISVSKNLNEYIIPDIKVKDTDDTNYVLPYMPHVDGTVFSCSPIPSMIFNPTKTGKITSYYAGDDGDIQAGRLIDFYTLDFTNPFGNTIRFTNDLGGTVWDGSDGSTADYVIDNATRLGWKQDVSGISLSHFRPNIYYALALVIGAYSNFRLANLNEYVTICNDQISTFRPDGTIFLLIGSYCWLNQSQNATTAYRAIYNLSIAQRSITGGDANARGMYCRNHIY